MKPTTVRLDDETLRKLMELKKRCERLDEWEYSVGAMIRYCITMTHKEEFKNGETE